MLSRGCATRSRGVVGWSVLTVALLVLAPGCSTVIVERDDAVDTSAAGPTSTVTGSSGAGGDPGAGAGGPGTGGSAPIDACATLGWEHEPHGVDQVVEEDFERWSVVDGARLAIRDDGVHVLQSGRAQVLVDEDWEPDAGARSVHWSRVEGAWEGQPVLVESGARRWSRRAARPWFVAITGGEDHVRWNVGVETPGDPRHSEGYGPGALSELWRPDQGGAGKPLPTDVELMRDVVPLKWGMFAPDIVVAIVNGIDRLTAWRGPRTELVQVDFHACGDRELAVDVEPLDGRPVAAFASGGDGCGPPTQVQVATLGAEGATLHGAIDLGAPVQTVQLVDGAGGPWIVARTEGADEVTLLRLGADLAIEHRARLSLAADREVTATTWSTGLVVVDTGAGDATTPWIRVRALDREGVVQVESAPPPWDLRPEGPPAALGSAADDAVLVTFAERTAAGLIRHRIVRADCAAE